MENMYYNNGEAHFFSQIVNVVLDFRDMLYKFFMLYITLNEENRTGRRAGGERANDHVT